MIEWSWQLITKVTDRQRLSILELLTWRSQKWFTESGKYLVFYHRKYWSQRRTWWVKSQVMRGWWCQNREGWYRSLYSQNFGRKSHPSSSPLVDKVCCLYLFGKLCFIVFSHKFVRLSHGSGNNSWNIASIQFLNKQTFLNMKCHQSIFHS